MVGLERKQISFKYIEVINDLYNGPATSLRIIGRETSAFLITEGFTLVLNAKSLLIALVMYELTRYALG